LYFWPTDIDDMPANTRVEQIFINPSIEGSENLEPMTHALMHEIQLLKRVGVDEEEEGA